MNPIEVSCRFNQALLNQSYIYLHGLYDISAWYYQTLANQITDFLALDANNQIALTVAGLQAESDAFEGRGGTSAEANCCGFEPAFLDRDSGKIYRSCFANGIPAPVHMLAGLPDEIVLTKDDKGQIIAIKPSVVSGFVRAGNFYTREQACDSSPV